MTKRLSWGILGTGNIARQFAIGINASSRCNLMAVGSRTADKAAAFARTHSLPAAYASYQQLIEDPAIQAVYNSLPNNLHYEWTIKALKAGKHVLCEKPMANSVEDCQAMIDAAKAANKKLQIGYRLQHEPVNMKAIALLRSGELGKIKNIEAGAGFNIGDPTQWRLNKKMAGGGSLMDIGIYALNACRYLTGEEPAEVNAMTYSTPNDVRFKEVEETMLFTLRFASGILTNCSSSYGFGVNRFKVTCEKGFVEGDPFLSYADLRLFARMPGQGERQDITPPQVDQFGAEMDFLARCILDNKQPRTPGEEGLRDLKVITALYESARSGRAVKVV